jgi:hypothetical protein
MNVEKYQAAMPAPVGANAFVAYGGAAAQNRIVGDLLKYSKGDWLAGKEADELPAGTELVAGMQTLTVGFQRWENQRPTDARLGLLVDGFNPPARHELGDNDQSLWERDDFGKARDPWVPTNYIQLSDPADPKTIYTFTTSSRGGLSAIGKLCAEYGRGLAKEGREGQLPLVRLDSSSYAHKDRTLGRIKVPTLEIIGWVKADDFTRVRDDIKDEIPY